MSYNQITDILIVIEQIYEPYCFKAVGINLSFCKYRPTAATCLWKLQFIIYNSQISVSVE